MKEKDLSTLNLLELLEIASLIEQEAAERFGCIIMKRRPGFFVSFSCVNWIISNACGRSGKNDRIRPLALNRLICLILWKPSHMRMFTPK